MVINLPFERYCSVYRCQLHSFSVSTYFLCKGDGRLDFQPCVSLRSFADNQMATQGDGRLGRNDVMARITGYVGKEAKVRTSLDAMLSRHILLRSNWLSAENRIDAI